MDRLHSILSECKSELAQMSQNIKKEMKNAPKGYIRARKTKKGFSIFSKIKYRDGYTEKAINDNPELIHAYIQKAIDKILVHNIENNIRLLDKLLSGYLTLDKLLILNLLPDKYKHANSVSRRLSESSHNCLNYDQHCTRDEDHYHQTNCGIWVASKNEVFICNSLDEHGIKYEYEPSITIFGRTYRPDFIIHFPDGTKWIWEHFGLVQKLEYCKANAYKINDYFNSGYIPGKNFIITISNLDGSIDLLQVEEIIKNKILPKYLQ